MRRIRALAATASVGAMALVGVAVPAEAQQTGLINVNVEDVAVLNNLNVPVQVVAQVPIGIAANVCNVNAAVLVAGIADTGDDSCDADATSTADSRAFQNLLARQGLRLA